jgi:hypothetical protein
MTATASPTQSAFSDGKPITDNPARVRPPSRGFARYMLAICLGVAATLAWQSYGQATKQMVATRAPQLGWSPQAQQTIANWVEQLGWTKPAAGSEIATARPSALETAQAAPFAQNAPDKVTPSIAASLDSQQLQQLVLDTARCGRL